MVIHTRHPANHQPSHRKAAFGDTYQLNEPGVPP
jgi:hypothetical protein